MASTAIAKVKAKLMEEKLFLSFSSKQVFPEIFQHFTQFTERKLCKALVTK